MGEYSARLGLYFAGGGSSGTHGVDEIADIDNAVNDNLLKLENSVGFKLVTSASRPSNPYLGMPILETDTGKGFVWSGSQWLQIVDLNLINGFSGSQSTRDTYWGNPGTGTSTAEITARATLANKGARWFRTDLGYEQRYFAKVGDTGALDSNVALSPGWYPSGNGIVPQASVNFKVSHAAVAIGVGETVFTTNTTFLQEMTKPVGGLTYGTLDGTSPGLRFSAPLDGIYQIDVNVATNFPNFNILVKRNSVSADYAGLVALSSAGSATALGNVGASLSKEVRMAKDDFLILALHTNTAGSIANSFEENFQAVMKWSRPRTR